MQRDQPNTHDWQDVADAIIADDKVALVQHFKGPQDVNGNPRRVWVGYSAAGTIIRVQDEGYAGRPSWARDPEVNELPEVTISVREYRAWTKAAL